MSQVFRIIGAGEWGLSYANHLANLGVNVEVYIRNPSTISMLQSTRSIKNINLELHKEINLYLLNDLLAKNESGNIINILAPSSSGFSDILSTYSAYFNQYESLTWLTKGLDHDSGLLFHALIDDLLSPSINKAIISGPSFASDLNSKKNIRISIASTSKELIKIISDASVTNYFYLAPTNNIIGVEISGILKNISAIIAGALTINGYPDEYIENLIAKSQHEVQAMSEHLLSLEKNHHSDIILDNIIDSPACNGDMHLTCFHDTSRNRQLGLKLKSNYDVKKALKSIGTVEGYSSTYTLYNNPELYKKNVIVETAYNILYKNSDIDMQLKSLFL